MIDTPTIVRTERQETAVIHLDIPRSEIRRVMDPAIREVMSVVTGQAIGPIGPLCAYHLGTSKERFDFEVGFPVRAPVKPSGRVKPGELPAARVARTIYRGPYEDLFNAWAEFNAWVDANGHRREPRLWERYLNGPDASSDPSRLQTELNRPLRD